MEARSQEGPALSRSSTAPEDEGDEVAARAIGALESGEYTGEPDFAELLIALGRAMRPAKVAQELTSLSLEWMQILWGASELKPDPKDWRFRDTMWVEDPFYRRLGQWYLALSRSLENLIDQDADWRSRERERLAVEFITAALAPTNVLFGNPEALKRAVETGGMSLLSGAQNVLQDLLHNEGMPAQVDASALRVGRDLALTEGAVVFRNEVLELLQYRPQTARVYGRPTLVIPPQINKYYFLDLAPGRSFVEHAVSQGIQPFMVSWRNPTVEHRHWNLDTYVSALLEATEAVRDITGSKQLNAFGFCAGGITMSALAGYLAARRDRRLGSLSYAVTLLDWSAPAPLGALQSKSLLRTIKRRSRRRGVFEGKELARLFSWLRPNDLVWNYWVNNYLLGKAPPSFDILAWNADTTNLPGALHVDFLDIFSHSPFARPGAWRTLGEPVNLQRVACDAFVTGALNDHLTPWQGCYRTTQLLGGKSTFVLSHAGHIASLVNPPGNPKASYLSGPAPGPDCEAWLAQASRQQGSWWTAWIEWVRVRSGRQAAAPKALGSRRFPPLEPAPGGYVLSPSSAAHTGTS